MSICVKALGLYLDLAQALSVKEELGFKSPSWDAMRPWRKALAGVLDNLISTSRPGKGFLEDGPQASWPKVGRT